MQPPLLPYLAGFPSCIQFACIQKNSVLRTNVRPRHADFAKNMRLYIFINVAYAQPKSCFIHSVHRVIHSSSRQNPRKIADFRGIIPTIHSLSTTLIRYAFICGYSCGHSQVHIPPVYVPVFFAYLCMFVHVRGACFASSGGLKCRISQPRKLSTVTKMKSPKESLPCVRGGLPSKKLRTRRGTEHMNHHLFLLLPRMVASGLAACFMKAEGLMPTMFLNCLEKW